MGKKMKLPSLLKNTEVKSSSSPSPSSSSWPWLTCHQPRTLSFRANNNNIFKTINSTYLDDTMDVIESSESFFTVSPDSASFSTTSEDSRRGGDSMETVIRGSRSDRLFFEPDETSSILEAKTGQQGRLAPFKDSVVLSMDSKDPYVDFQKSMEEMVEAHGVKDWESLEKLLGWYLRVNGKSNHGYIVGAFVDLLVGLAFVSASSSSSSCSSTPCVSILEAEEEVDDTTTPSSSLLLEQVKEEIKHEDEASSSSSNA